MKKSRMVRHQRRNSDCGEVNQWNCPVKFTADIISGKWKPLIIHFLKPGPIRYGQLRRRVQGTAHKVLTQQLRELEKDQVVTRTIIAGKVRGVEYQLSRTGKTLIPVLVGMAKWAKKHAHARRIHVDEFPPPLRDLQ